MSASRHAPVGAPLSPLIRTDRLSLRSWRPADAAALLSVLEANEPRLAPWIPARVARPAPLPELECRLAEFAADFVAGRGWRYAIMALADGAVLGEVSLFPRAASGRVPLAEADHLELGYWLAASATGKGIATEAARAMLDAAAALPGMARVEIRCDARNAPSSAVPRRLGFDLAALEEASGVDAAASPVTLEVWTLPLP
jgi:RimJ/RimL family protein N-acetyltransferase